MLALSWEVYERVLMALALWREARGESFQGRAAVAWSIVNRVRNPGWWGKTIAEVVTKRWQYSSMTDPKDHQLIKFPQAGDWSFLECMSIVDGVLDGQTANPIGEADSYHDTSIADPQWAMPDKFVAQIGRLKFYKVG